MKWLFAIVVMVGPLAFSGEPVMPATPPANSMEALDDTRPLKAGERISIHIVEDKGRTQSVLVQENGMVMCPHIGLIRAEGLTARALAQSAKVRLEKGYFAKATVLLKLEKSPAGGIHVGDPPNGRFYTVIGGGRPGKYAIKQGEELTVSQAIIRTGGFVFRSPRQVRVIRQGPQGEIITMVELRDIIIKGNLAKDIEIRVGDIIDLTEEKRLNL